MWAACSLETPVSPFTLNVRRLHCYKEQAAWKGRLHDCAPRVPTHRAPTCPVLPPSSPSGVPISGLRPDSSSHLPLSPGLSQEGAKSSLGSKCPDGTSWANHCQMWGAQQGGCTHRPGHPQPGPGVCRCSGLRAAATAGNTMSPSFYGSIYHRTTRTRVPKSNSTKRFVIRQVCPPPCPVPQVSTPRSCFPSFLTEAKPAVLRSLHCGRQPPSSCWVIPEGVCVSSQDGPNP